MLTQMLWKWKVTVKWLWRHLCTYPFSVICLQGWLIIQNVPESWLLLGWVWLAPCPHDLILMDISLSLSPSPLRSMSSKWKTSRKRRSTLWCRWTASKSTWGKRKKWVIYILYCLCTEERHEIEQGTQTPPGRMELGTWHLGAFSICKVLSPAYGMNQRWAFPPRTELAQNVKSPWFFLRGCVIISRFKTETHSMILCKHKHAM